MGTAFNVEPLDASFGARIRGISLSGLDEDTWQALYRTWLEYALLVFPGQHLSQEEQIAFANRFGPLELELFPLSNAKPDGTVYSEAEDHDYLNLLRGNESWHCDSTFKQVQAKGAVFSAGVLPDTGTQTGFADMRAAYDALDGATRAKVEKLTAHHSIHYAQQRMGLAKKKGLAPSNDYPGAKQYDSLKNEPVPRRPLVKVHPETGRKSLLIGRHAHAIRGMDFDESEAFLEELIESACQPPRVYYHDWQPGDAVLWDNRCLLHRSVPWDMSLPRIMWHTRIAGDSVSEAALG